MPWLRNRLGSAGAALLALAASACGSAEQHDPLGQVSEPVVVCPGATTTPGIDVNAYKGTIDWTAVKAEGIEFAYARAWTGTATDALFAQYWSGMSAAGLLRGAYMFFRPEADPSAQADAVINAVGGSLAPGDLPVAIEVDATGGQPAATIAANLAIAIDKVATGTGRQPLILTSAGFWNGSVASSQFASVPLYVAHWGVSCPNTPTGWSAWTLWQSTDAGAVSGVTGAVDRDSFNGTLAQLRGLAGIVDGDAGVDAASDGATDDGTDAEALDATAPDTSDGAADDSQPAPSDAAPDTTSVADVAVVDAVVVDAVDGAPANDARATGVPEAASDAAAGETAVGPSGDDGGCSCTAAPHGGARPFALFTLGVLGMTAGRRRRPRVPSHS
jgi:MYXO-CTERM domain-containing protein